MMTPLLRLMAAAFATMLAWQTPLAAQGLFETVITVNDQIITRYEIEQRKRFLGVLRTPGDLDKQARDGLIEDRLRLSETGRVGIVMSDEQVEQGMEEFAGRANLSREQFIAAIGAEGVSEQTFRDFVAAGFAWRSYVQARFGPRSQISEAEIDRALTLSTSRGGARVLLAEIILPLAPQVEAQNRRLATQLSSSIKTTAAFSAAAREYSASQTRNVGGRLEWLPLGNLPPALRTEVLTLQPGEVTEPISLGPALGLFQLRSIEELEAEPPETLALDYATIMIPGGRSEAARAEARKLANSVDTCDDLYPYARGKPADAFSRVTEPFADVPNDIALELAKLDGNEISTALTREGDTVLMFLMLCGRTLEIPDEEPAPVAAPAAPEGDGDAAPEDEIAQANVPDANPDQRARIRDRLVNQRLSSYADSFLDELRADAIIIEK